MPVTVCWRSVHQTNLASQHEPAHHTNAEKFTELNVKNGQDTKAHLQDAESLEVCLNSLANLGDIDDYELENYVKEVFKGWFFFAFAIGPMFYKTYISGLNLRDEAKQ